MKTTLQADVEVWEISVLAEVAVWESRPELGRLCRSGTAAGRLDDKAVDAALPGLSDAARRNVLRSLEHLRLIEANGTLTAFGRRCADSGAAPAWELGCFTFLVALHPCFGTLPIAFKREKSEGLDQDFNSLEEIPAWFKPGVQELWPSALGDKKSFTIADFPAPPGQARASRCAEKPAARLVWDLDLVSGQNQLHIEGALDDASATPYRTSDRAVPTAEVTGLFATWDPRWNAAAGKLLLPYDGAANKDGRDNFVRTMPYAKVKAGGRGTFESARVEGVPVAPPDAPAARKWAVMLALARANAAAAYVSPASWAAEWGRIVLGTPLQSAGACPELVQLLDEQTTLPSRLRWLLATGADLAMD